MTDIFLLTEDRYVNPSDPDEYVKNILLEDALVADALRNKGLSVQKVSWSDPSVKWEEGRFALFRTTWDYFERFEEFDNWLKATEGKIQFINPIGQIRWNMDKHYLADLESKGVPIVPTHFIEAGDSRSLKEIVSTSPMEEMILKPAVAGAARHTYRLNKENVDELEATFSMLIQNESMLIQPFLNTVLSKGEVSFIILGGKYTHAILKKAKEGDFRVQDDFGGSIHEHLASELEIEFAEGVVAQCEPMPLYARVDVMVDENDKMLVSELELIEPELWFRKNEASADVLAESIFLNMSDLSEL